MKSPVKRTRRDDKELEICTTSLEFELEHAPIVRTWDSQGCTRSPESTKCAFREVGFSQIKKKQ
jgi:hypothetical protein